MYFRRFYQLIYRYIPEQWDRPTIDFNDSLLHDGLFLQKAKCYFGFKKNLHLLIHWGNISLCFFISLQHPRKIIHVIDQSLSKKYNLFRRTVLGWIKRKIGIFSLNFINDIPTITLSASSTHAHFIRHHYREYMGIYQNVTKHLKILIVNKINRKSENGILYLDIKGIISTRCIERCRFSWLYKRPITLIQSVKAIHLE